jgi:hypothetical protein
MKKFRDFESAREFVRKLKLKNTTEWQEYCKSGNKPDDIPSSPSNNYKKDFKGSGDWLGNGKTRDWRNFEEAREFAITLNLKNHKEWIEYCKSGNKPENIPSYPKNVYIKDFKGVGDWLGTGIIADKDKVYRPYKEARDFVRALNLKGIKEWQEYCKSGNKPDDIPANPDRTYKKDFKGFGDFLGTGRIAYKDKAYRPYKEAREFVRNLNLKSMEEWKKYCKSGNKPDDIRVHPDRTYKKDFKGFGDWLGTGTIAPQNKVYRPYKEAREFVRKLNLKNFTEWQEYCKSGDKPDDIPSAPKNSYKNKEYLNLGDWLGTGNVAAQDKEYRPFKEAREFVRKLNLKNFTEWTEYCKSGNKPDDIPSSPKNNYKNKGYVDLGDWLGTGHISSHKRIYRNFTEAREFVRALNLKGYNEWIEYCKSGDKPNDIPRNPWVTYKKEKKK